MSTENRAATPEPAPTEAMTLEVETVTGTRSFVASDIDPMLPAGVLAKTLSAELALPQNVPWMLRDSASASFLENERAIGEQVESGAKVTLTPRTHLG